MLTGLMPWAPSGREERRHTSCPQAVVNLIREKRWIFISERSGDLSRAKQLPSGDSFKPPFYKTELLRRGPLGSEALTVLPQGLPLTSGMPSGPPMTSLGPPPAARTRGGVGAAPTPYIVSKCKRGRSAGS